MHHSQETKAFKAASSTHKTASAPDSHFLLEPYVMSSTVMSTLFNPIGLPKAKPISLTKHNYFEKIKAV